jgi:hypothetical protein
MVKKLELEVPDEVYEHLSSLCAFYKQDPHQIILKILEAVGREHSVLTCLSKRYTPTKDIEAALSEIISTFNHSSRLFDYIPNKLGVKGGFCLQDFDVNFEENYFMFYYSATPDNPSNIDSFDVTKEPGCVSLSTNTGFYVDEVGLEALNKLKQVAKKQDFKLPNGFEDVDDIDVEIEENEEMWTLRINIWAEILEDLPTLKQVSQLIKRICRKAGISQKK